MGVLKSVIFTGAAHLFVIFILGAFFHIYLNVAHHERLVNEAMW